MKIISKMRNFVESHELLNVYIRWFSMLFMFFGTPYLVYLGAFILYVFDGKEITHEFNLQILNGGFACSYLLFFCLYVNAKSKLRAIRKAAEDDLEKRFEKIVGE